MQWWTGKFPKGFIVVLAVGLGALAVGGLAALRTSSEGAGVSHGCGAWHVLGREETDVPLSFTRYSVVDAVAPDDIWFAGTWHGLLNEDKVKLAFGRWDGRRLVEVPGPDIDAAAIHIEDMDARAADDIWVVGYALRGNNGERPDRYWQGWSELLTFHWDGKEWKQIPTPKSFVGTDGKEVEIKSGGIDPDWGNYPKEHPRLQSVTVLSEKDAWAVGQYWDGFSYRTLTIHWNGNEWQVITSPNHGKGENHLYAVVARTSDEVWAFGYASQDRHITTLQWDGEAWKMVDSPNGFLAPWAAAFSPSGNLWVVGGEAQSWSAVRGKNDTDWNMIPVPYIQFPFIRSLVAPADNDFWVAGSKWSGRPPNAQDHQDSGTRSMMIHWNGKAWHEVIAPDPSWLQSVDDITAAGKGNIWAVGTTSDHEDGPSRGMVAHFVSCPGSTVPPTVESDTQSP